MSRWFFSALTAFVFLTTSVCRAAPTTEPAPYALIMPADMRQISAAGHTAICPPQYAAAAAKGLANVTPATQPTTSATELIQRLADTRATIIAQMSAELSVPPDKVAGLLDGKIRPAIQKMAELHPHLYILVATQKQVTAALKAGWHAPLFHYNQLADYTLYSSHVIVPMDRPMDDVVLWSEVKDGESDSAISDALTKDVEDFERGFPNSSANSAILQLRNLIIGFIADHVVAPLKLPSSSQWFGLGLCGTMSSKYTAEVTGLPRAGLMRALVADSAANPISAREQDLLHEFDITSVRPAYLPYYLDAISRKGATVVQKILDQRGDAVVAKIIAAIKAHPPADNLATVSLIQNVTGMDLTSDLLPPP